MAQLHHPLQALISHLSKLPGVGAKSAQRLAFFLLQMPASDVRAFAQEMIRTRETIQYCQCCFNISFAPVCAICEDTGRDVSVLCVVAEPKDIFPLERAHEFRGRYHVLGGLISPLDGFGPDVLRIPELLDRVKSHGISEVILALSPTVEGDATMLYLTKLLLPLRVPVTKLAYGLPMGADIEYADDMTLLKAFQGRTRVQQ